MKRVRGIFEKVVSKENLERAIMTVVRSHRWVRYADKPNRKAVWLERTLPERVKELRAIITQGFEPSHTRKKRRWDANACKWREIAEPRLWPDQCVHHALIQALEPVMMRGMDHWCCGSIKNRGAHFGIRGMKKWMGRRGTKWCIEMDIRHFYDSLEPSLVVGRFRSLIKDRLTLDLIERVLRDGVQIGAYCSQWFANTFLQPLDVLIRSLGVRFYVRYMDNFTVIVRDKGKCRRVVRLVSKWLHAHGLSLKGNWQWFKVRDRLPNALGYRFGKGYTLMRKKNLLRLSRNMKRFARLRGRAIPVRFAQGLLSRLGQLRHCSSVGLYARFVPNGSQRVLKDVVREWQRKEAMRWSMCLAG